MASYSPNSWTDGETITKTKLDRLEAGTAAALATADAPELIRDTVGATIVVGPYMTKVFDDANETTTLNAVPLPGTLRVALWNGSNYAIAGTAVTSSNRVAGTYILFKNGPDPSSVTPSLGVIDGDDWDPAA